MNWLLLFVPITIALEHLAPERHLLIFVASGARDRAARRLDGARHRAARRRGSARAWAGCLNATFGNAAELIIAFAALRAGLHTVVKASLVGSIVGNILLVLGAAMLAGGLRHKEQHYNAAGRALAGDTAHARRDRADPPAAYRAAAGAGVPEIGSLSVWIALVLLAVYGANLVFSLVTHAKLFAGEPAAEGHGHEAAVEPRPRRGRARRRDGGDRLDERDPGRRDRADLARARAERCLRGRVRGGDPRQRRRARHRGHGGACSNRMDLSLSIAIGSSVQVALFVAPLLVLASLFVGPTPMDLAFNGGMVLTVLLAVLITGQVAGDGRSDWLKGVQLLAVYVILGLAYFFAPAPPG